MNQTPSTQSASELDILSRVGRIAVADLELAPMLERTCDTLRALLGWDLVAIALVDAEHSTVVCQALSSELETTVRVGDDTLQSCGALGALERSGAAIVVNEPDDDSLRRSLLVGAKSLICVPILHRNVAFGLLHAESRQRGAFAESLKFIELVAAQIAGAIAAGRNLERCERHSAMIENALQVNRLALNAIDLESMAESIVQFLKQRFNLSWVSLSIATPGDAARGPKLVAVSDANASVLPTVSWDERGGVVGRAAISGQSQLVADVREDPDYIERCALTRSELALPLHFQGKMLGVLNLESAERNGFGAEQRHVFDVAAAEFAAVVHMASLSRELDRVNRALAGANSALSEAMQDLRLQAELDDLTGVPNRRLFDATLRREWDRARRFGRGVGLVMLDLDHFKELNDTAGHIAGDEALRAVGRLLDDHLRRGGDFVARYGGEEFVVLLADVEEWQTYAHAEQLRNLIEHAGLIHPTRVSLTVSAGAAWMLATPEHSPNELLAAADARMYEAKRAGRNRSAAAPAFSATARATTTAST